MSKSVHCLLPVVPLILSMATANAADSVEPGPGQCPARPTVESRVGAAVGEDEDVPDKPAVGSGLKPRLLSPPGMHPRWHSFLPGMFR